MPIMKPEYFYQKNEFVFAETTGHPAYPARVTKVNIDLGIYTVSFIGYKSTSDVLAANMEKFDDYNINKYVRLYQSSNDSKVRNIVKKIEAAKKEYDRIILKNRKKQMKKGSKKSSESGQNGEQLYSKQRLQSEMAQTKATPDQYEQIRDSEGVKSQLNEDNSSNYFNILNHHQKPTIDKHPYADIPPAQHYLVEQQAVQEQVVKEQQIKRQIEQNLAKLSPIRSNPDTIAEAISQGIRSQSSSTPELLTSQTVSSVASLHFPLHPNKPKKEKMIKQPIEVIKEQNEISRNANKQANHPIYDRQYANISSVSCSSIDGEAVEKPINVCEEVNIYEIDCSIDELQLQETDYWGMLEYMTYRKKKLSILSYQQIIGHLVKILDILLAELARARRLQEARMLIMKKKQYLIGILSLSVPLKYFLNGNCLKKMIQFVAQFEASIPTVKSMFVIENFNIRSRLNILYQQFLRIDPTQLSLSQEIYDEIQRKFEQYKEMKFVY